MLIKEEPVSPGVRAGVKGGSVGGGDTLALTSSCEVCTSEPPVLPVAMVQSVLEGRGSSTSVTERRIKRATIERYALLSSRCLCTHNLSLCVFVTAEWSVLLMQWKIWI